MPFLGSVCPVSSDDWSWRGCLEAASDLLQISQWGVCEVPVSFEVIVNDAMRGGGLPFK